MSEKSQPGTRFLKKQLLYRLPRKINLTSTREDKYLFFNSEVYFFPFHSQPQISSLCGFMAKNNLTIVTEFILMGFPDYPELEIPFVMLEFSIWSPSGEPGHDHSDSGGCPAPHPNVLLPEPPLPADTTSAITPQALPTLAAGRTVISYGQCSPVLLLHHLCRHGVFLLSVMGLDRYVAVSSPLLSH